MKVCRSPKTSTRFIQVWEAETGSEIARINLETFDELPTITSMSFSPDGKYIGTYVSWSGVGLRIWEIATTREISRIVYDDGITSFAFSPDGKYVVIGSFDRTSRIRKRQPDDLIADACSRVPRNLSRAEWELYVGETVPYQAVCANLPIDPEAITPSP